jgi:NAD(P)-dependent dehydrogenase (short-subunit alcohol dehydrogenase family)
MAEPEKGAFGLAGQVCVVTGGGSGIGRATAVAFAAEGALLGVLDRNLTGAKETVDIVSNAGGAALAISCDVSDQGSVEAASRVVREGLGDDAQVLVNNAGVGGPGPLESLSLSEWNRVISINLTGYFLCAQAFGRAMRARGSGALVHVSSINADFPGPYSGAYSISKAGVSMLSRLLALEWGPLGIRSNTVQPGMIQTPLTQAVYDRPGVTEARAQAVPSRRVGQPEDIAQAILFLASPRASYVNGTELVVDGGVTRNLLSFIPRRDQYRPNSARG